MIFEIIKQVIQLTLVLITIGATFRCLFLDDGGEE